MKATIGIEVHAELNTKSKMFCGCFNDPHNSEPNTNICEVCMAHPGTLPVVNKEAIKKVLLFGKAVGGELADFSEFDRKQYFYPDIPKAYQLSQYAYPFVKGGKIADVLLTRVHLEEDTAKSSHTNANSLVDFNRAGVPLMELVTEPVIHDADSAVKFAKELQLLLRSLGISEANMEKGEMRVEANISVSPDSNLGTKVEVKNLNSFKSMRDAIEFEISRQSEMIAKKEHIKQETRGWDEKKSRTFSQRSKETADDYRYFPDPDIPKYKISDSGLFNKAELSLDGVDLPDDLRAKYSAYGIPDNQIEILLTNNNLRLFFEQVLDTDGAVGPKFAKLAANYVSSDLLGILATKTDHELNFDHTGNFKKLVNMLIEGKIGSRVAKDMLPMVITEGIDPEVYANEKGLLQTSSLDDLQAIVDKVIEENPKVVEDYKSGKEASIQYLVGQGMKVTKGSANPGVLLEVLKKSLD